AHHLRQPSRDGESQAGAAKLAGALSAHLGERAKNRFQLVPWNADAGVFHFEDEIDARFVGFRSGGALSFARARVSRVPAPFSPALRENSFWISSTILATDVGSYCSSSLPASILDKSRMSLMSVSNVLPLEEMASRYWRSLEAMSCVRSSSENPRIAFIGVR